MILKLDFNERADSTPQWLIGFKADTQCLWQYPNKQEVESLIAVKYSTTIDNVFLSNGGDEAIELLFKLCKLNSQSILLPTPAFSQYTHQLNIWNINNTIVSGLENLSIDVIKIKQNLKPKQWLILTRPNNPTGECLAEEVLISLIEYSNNIGAYVFLDEAYVEFYLENSDVNYALQYNNVISLRTFSKAYGLAGARLGYLIGNNELIRNFKNIAMPFNVNQISLQLAKLALKNNQEVEYYCEIIAINRGTVLHFLLSCSIEVFNGKGNFLLFKVKPQVKTLLKSFMHKNGIQIKTQVNDLQDWVRITIPENIDQLMSVLQSVFKPEILGFDMDGVLIDTSKSYDACIIKTVKYFTETVINVVNITQLRDKGGFNNDWDLTQVLIQQAGYEIDYKKVVDRFQIFYQQLKQYEINLLQKKNIFFNGNYTTAIITGRPKNEASEGVKQLHIQPDYIISADDVSEQKPSPVGINWLLSKTNMNRMWFCGDTVDDMQAGKASNCVCIGIGENSEILYQAGADIVLNNINQLSELL